MTDRPSVIFAYTIKAWRLATQGHPANHSALLSVEQWEQLAADPAPTPPIPWARFAEGSPRGRAVPARRRPPGARADRRRRRPAAPRRRRPDAHRQRLDAAGVRPLLRRPCHTRRRRSPRTWSRSARRRLVDEPRRLDQPRRHLAPRASASTGSPTTPTRWCAGARPTHGQHIELGIAEGNLVGLLGELGATWSRDGQPLLPIGTLYDPFVNRALEPWSFGMYAGGQSILVGTPSGVTLAPEGGAHQSIIDALDRTGAAALHRLGARVRPGPRVDAALRAGAAGPPRRHLLVLPPDDPAARPGARRDHRTTRRARAPTP